MGKPFDARVAYYHRHTDLFMDSLAIATIFPIAYFTTTTTQDPDTDLYMWVVDTPCGTWLLEFEIKLIFFKH